MNLQNQEDGFGGTTPTGYKSVGYELMKVKEYNESNELVCKTKKAFMLEEITEEMITIKIIFEKFLELKSMTAVETFCINNNIKTKNNRDFSKFAIKSILINPVYAINDLDMYEYFIGNNVEVFSKKEDFDGKHGIMAYNKTKQVKHKAKKMNEMKDWIIAVGKHKGFIDGKTWLKVQTILKNNETKSYRKPKKNEALLTGIIYCSQCMSPMRPRLQANRYDENGRQKFSYSCTLKEKSRCKKCNGKNIDGRTLDEEIIKKIQGLMAPDSLICTELKNIINTKDNIVSEDEEYINLKTKYDKNQKMLETLIDRIKYIDIDLIDEINKEIKKIKKENEEIGLKLNDFKKQDSIGKIEADTAKLVLDIIEKSFYQFELLDIVEKKSMLRLLIDKVYGNGDKIEVDLLTSNTKKAFFNNHMLPIDVDSK